MTLTPANRVALLDVARAALRARLEPGSADKLPIIPADAHELLQPAGCFVTLHELATHRLRGCVGRLDADKALWQTVYFTATDVLSDPRFTDHPVTAREQQDLEIEISVLSPPRQAPSPLDFDPLDDGIYLLLGKHAGFFLPQVARETGWTRQQLLSRLCVEKMGLPPDDWQRHEARLYTFSVDVIGPEPLVVS